VSSRVKELAEREALLQARCAAQRAAVAREVTSIETRLERVDRIARVARATLLHPVVIVGGIVALMTIGRSRGVRLVGRLYLMSTAVGRLLQTIKLFQGLASKASPTLRREPS
jgi:hypothetical protein